MSMQENDNAQWLRKYAAHLLRSAEKQEKAEIKHEFQTRANRLFKIANALEQSVQKFDPFSGTGSGSREVNKMTAPDTPVNLKLITGEQIGGEIGLSSRYDITFRTVDGRMLVVPKHSVLFYEMLDYGPDGLAADEEE